MKRNNFLLLAVILASGTLALASCGQKENTDKMHFYVGSGNGQLSHPITLCELDPVAETITVLDSFPAEGGAGYLALSPDGKYLFATSGKSSEDDPGMGSLAAFRVQEDHSLVYLNRQSSRGRGTCHVQTNAEGTYVFAANYSSGDALALPVGPEGELGESTALVKGEGSGPNKSRQKSPHAHMAMPDPSGNFFFVPDLGTDKVMNYVFDPESGSLEANPAQPFLALAPGSGPRHMAFHPKKNLAYILGELDASLTACTFDPKTGELKIINVASIVEEGFDGNFQSAAVRVHPNGRFIYATNRDDESNLAVFTLKDKGGLERSQIEKDIPYWPRDFNISPDGKYLVIAGARVNELALYRIDTQTGKVSDTGSRATVDGPICVLFTD